MARYDKAASRGKLSDKLLERMLGKEKTIDAAAPTKAKKDGSPSKRRQVMKKTVVERGRKSAGPKGPRGAPTGRSLEEQLMSAMGESPDVTNRAVMATQILSQMGEPAPADVMLEEAMGVPATRPPAGIGPQTPYVQAGTYAPAPNEAVSATDGPAGRALAKGRVSEPVDDSYNDADAPNYAGTTQNLGEEEQMMAVKLFVDKYGHEPASDGEIVEAEQLFMETQSPTGPVAPSPEEEILKKIMGQ